MSKCYLNLSFPFLFHTLLSKNIEFIFSVTYNMIEYLRYNSTEHKILLAQAEFVLNPCNARVNCLFFKDDSVNQKAMLVCSAYDFYPKPIKLMWMRDEMKSGKDLLCGGVCSLTEHIVRIFFHFTDPSLPDSERSKIILGSVGLLMGVFMAAGGLIYYKTHRLVTVTHILTVSNTPTKHASIPFI
uniref:Immunoglobulin C1-set domain-containing protein n=1 Tax=Cyprinus carpio TaxID=7962 RepID=A0A8C2FE98_CYPCA